MGKKKISVRGDLFCRYPLWDGQLHPPLKFGQLEIGFKIKEKRSLPVLQGSKVKVSKAPSGLPERVSIGPVLLRPSYAK